MKCGQLIEYNMRKVFVKCGGETTPKFFFKKLKSIICLDQ